MASAALGDELTCSICLNLYKEPMFLRCGHNFCQECIVTTLDTQERSGIYSCPECRAEYVERPTVEKNRKLCNIVENFISTQTKEDKGEIFCTYCVDSPTAAIKTCVQCETSMCEKHLTAHNKTVDHVLIEPTSSFSSKKCSIHKKLLEYYCSEDSVCLCVSCCLVGKHKGHEVELLEDAFEKKKEKLRDVLEKLTMKRKATEQKIQNLLDHKREVQKKEEDEKKRVTTLFENFRKQLEVQEQKVLSEISRQVEEVSRSVTDLTKQLEIQKEELSRNICYTEKICNMTDPITGLQAQETDTGKVQQDPGPGTKNVQQDPGSDTDDIQLDSGSDTDDVQLVSGSDTDDVQLDLGSDTEEVLQDSGSDTGDRNVVGSSVRDLDIFMISLVLHRSITDLISNLQLKGNFIVQESQDLLLDEKTANESVTLSDDLRTASESEICIERPQLPERFTEFSQVMSVQCFSCGRHYWEVEVSDCGKWDVAVCYPSIPRDGDESGIGFNNKSWSFCIEKNKYKTLHDYVYHMINVESPVQKVGVYLDYEAGRLSYYHLCDPVRHLHTFTTTFTEPLHAAFYLQEGGWVRLAAPVSSVKL